MNEREALKPCPCCGGEAKMEQYRADGLRIQCRSCALKREQRWLRYGREWLEAKMITDWNHRAALASAPAAPQAEPVATLNALAKRSMLGITIRYRRYGTTWPGPWQAQHHSTKWIDACQTAYGETLDEALNNLLTALHDTAGWMGGWPILAAPTPQATAPARASEARHVLQQMVEATAPADPWRDAVINELVVAHIYRGEHDTDPRKAIQDAITWHCQVALDPAVSSAASALVQRGRDEATAPAGAALPEKPDYHPWPQIGEFEAAGATSQAPAGVEHDFLELARLYCTVTETPWGDLKWTFAERDIERFAREVVQIHAKRPAGVEARVYPLPDDLYAGSKDWLAADYAGRVEWLHNMYEARKQEVAWVEAAHLRLLRAADALFAHHCKDATAWNWLDEVRAVVGGDKVEAAQQGQDAEDAARYRFLRDNPLDGAEYTRPYIHAAENCEDAWGYSGHAADAAIDAARKSHPQEGRMP